jgi:hypothetical protein
MLVNNRRRIDHEERWAAMVPADVKSRSQHRATIVLKIVGWAGVVLSLGGLWYHATYLRADYSRIPQPLYFFQAYYTMAGINIVLLIAGILLGVAFIRGNPKWVPLFVTLQAVVVLDAFVPGAFWLHPRFGSSIAAAGGISGGTMLQVIVLFPIWGSLAALWAARRIPPADEEPIRA